MKLVLLALLCLVFTTCRENNQSSVSEVGAQKVDPQKVPKDRTLEQPVPLVAVKVEASDAGYTIKAFRAKGTPTNKIDQSRDVVIKVIDGQGKELSAVSIFNPREIHTTGKNNPRTATLKQASFIVFFDQADDIRTIEVEVKRGANAPLKQSINVDPRDLPTLDQSGHGVPPDRDNTPTPITSPSGVPLKSPAPRKGP
jgi:hypothetical protein